MKKLILAGLLAVFAVPAVAQECDTLATVGPQLDEMGAEYKLLPADRVQSFVDEVAEPILGQEIEGVTNVIIAVLDTAVVFGLEFANGCLTPPIRIPGASAMPVVNM